MGEFESENPVTEEVTTNIENTPKKSSKKKFIFIGVGVVVAALVGVGVFFGIRMLKNSNPVKVTSNAIRGLKDTIKDVKDENPGYTKLLTGDEPYEINTKVKLTLPKDYGKYEADILAQVDAKEQMFKLDLEAKSNKEKLGALNLFLDKSYLFFKTPDTMSNYYKIDATEMLKELESSLSEIDTSYLELFAKYDYTKLIDYLADAIDATFDKDDFTKESDEISVKDKDIKVNKYTAKITGEKALNIVKNFLESVKKDDELIELIAKSEDASKKEIKETIDELIDELKDADVEGDEYILYSVYVSKTGKVIGYGFDIDNKNGLTFAKNGDVYEITVKYNGLTFRANIEKKSDNHYVISANVFGITIKVDITDEVETVKKNKEYKETFKLTFDMSYLGDSINAELSIISNVKKIDSIDKVKNAIEINDNMSLEQANKFQSEVERSSIYKTYEKLLDLTPQYGLVENNY